MILLFAARGLIDIELPWQYAIADDVGDHLAHRTGSSLCTTVDRNMPDLDQILIIPSSLAENSCAFFSIILVDLSGILNSFLEQRIFFSGQHF